MDSEKLIAPPIVGAGFCWKMLVVLPVLMMGEGCGGLKECVLGGEPKRFMLLGLPTEVPGVKKLVAFGALFSFWR